MGSRRLGIPLPGRKTGVEESSFVFAISGPTLITPSGQYVGVTATSLRHPSRPTRDLTAIAQSGMVVISAIPGNEEIARRIEAVRATLSIKRKLTSVIDEQYRKAASAASEGRGYGITVSGLISVKEGERIPDGFVPTLAVPSFVMFPSYRSHVWFACDEQAIVSALLPPSHSGYGVNPVLVGYSLEGMAQYVPLGGEQNARHMIFLGRTRSGKSTLVKEMLRQIEQSYGDRMRIVVADLKGEYVRRNESPDGTVLYDTLMPSMTVISKRDFSPLGWRVLQCKDRESAHTEALHEARMAQYVMEILGLPPMPGLVDLLMKAWERFAQEGSRQEPVIQKYLRAIYQAVSNKLPPQSTATVLFGGNGKIEKAHHVVIDLSWTTFGSPDQRAAFLWAINSLMPLFGASVFRRTVMAIEEFQLLPEEVVGTILRVCGGRGVSAMFITQSAAQLHTLQGAGEQFSAALYMAPQLGEIETVSQAIFRMELSPTIISQSTRAEIQEWGITKAYGWGAIISPVSGIHAAEVKVPPDFLNRIKEFNIGRRYGGSVSQDQDTI